MPPHSRMIKLSSLPLALKQHHIIFLPLQFLVLLLSLPVAPRRWSVLCSISVLLWEKRWLWMGAFYWWKHKIIRYSIRIGMKKKKCSQITVYAIPFISFHSIHLCEHIKENVNQAIPIPHTHRMTYMCMGMFSEIFRMLTESKIDWKKDDLRARRIYLAFWKEPRTHTRNADFFACWRYSSSILYMSMCIGIRGPPYIVNMLK